MPDCVDLKAREDIAKLYTEVRQHSTDYWGPDKNNGKRSVISDLVTRMDSVEEGMAHYIDTRRDTCLGIAALNKYIKLVEKSEEELNHDKRQEKTLMRVQWIQVLGLVTVALIALLK